MPLPIPSPTNTAHIDAVAHWQANIARLAAPAPPPAGRADCEASAIAAERALAELRRSRIG